MQYGFDEDNVVSAPYNWVSAETFFVPSHPTLFRQRGLNLLLNCYSANYSL